MNGLILCVKSWLVFRTPTASHKHLKGVWGVETCTLFSICEVRKRGTRRLKKMASYYNEEDAQMMFRLCRSEKWNTVLKMVRADPRRALNSMIMVNNISTTILHQAITSKGNISERAAVILTVLDLAPEAAKIRNGYGSLPLHVIAQRNTKMDSSSKEALIYALIQAYPGALVQEGGVGRRTPLHIAFTDYISPQLAATMIQRGGREATQMKDRKGWLPIHVACSRHCSPDKLRMLLEANPASLFDTTNEGQTLLDLATSTATKAHPNFALIAALNHELSKHQREMNTEKGDSRSKDGEVRFSFPQTSKVSSLNNTPSDNNASEEADKAITPDQEEEGAARYASPVGLSESQRTPSTKRVSETIPTVSPEEAMDVDRDDDGREKDRALGQLLLHFHRHSQNSQFDL